MNLYKVFVYNFSYIYFSCKISEGVTMEKILDDIRDNVHDILKVQTLITKKDLWNIKRDFNLYEGRQHSSDYISVNIWIHRMIELPEEENPVIHYNLDKENFILSHNIGVQINPETIKVIDDNRWEISAKETNMAYEVIHTIDVCNTEDCRLVCRKCNICIHNYTCECSDYIIKLNICKHIHACANLSVSNTRNTLCEKEKETLVPAAEINLIEKSIVKTNTDKEREQLIQIKNQLEAGKGVLSSLIASKSEVTEKEIAEMNKHSSSLLQILQGKRKIVEIEKNKEPVNKNIDKQKRFETKKRKVELLSGRIESNERKSLKEGLVLGEVQNIHTSNDHTY
ncbi:hypothetical protein ACI65C_013308 [Semiaphis heraclei]